MTLEELLEAMRALIEAAGAEPMAEEDMERYEELERQVAVLNRNTEIRSRQQAYDTPRRTDLHIHNGTQRTDDTLERAFNHYLRTGQENQDLVELRAQSTLTGAAGGFTVPEIFRQKLIERLVAFGGVANEVEVITTSGGEDMRWPTLDDTANQGVIAAEGAAPVGGADMVLGEKVLGAFKYTAPGASSLPLRVSVELLQDSAFDIEGLVSRKLGERIARAQAAHWVTGNGTTQPFGLDTSAGPDSTFAAATFGAAAAGVLEIVAAKHDVDPAYRPSAVWTFSDGTLEQLEGLTDTTGRPLLTNFSEAGIGGDPTAGMRLLGHRIVIDQAWPTYTDGVSQIFGAFGDLREAYVIRRIQDVTMIVNPFSRANEGQVEYTMWARADGVVQNDNALTLLNNAV